MTDKECSQNLEGEQDLVRCSFQLPREQYLILAGLEWGARGLFITKCVEAGLRRVERFGDKAAYAIILGDMDPMGEVR